MKTFNFACALMLLTSASILAADPRVDGAVTSLKVVETILPVFPHEMIQMGVRDGEARVAFSVDANGRLEDCLPIAYTHSEFARATVNALRRWKFEPARYNGQPMAAATEVTVKFEVEGTVVVSLSASESFNARIFSMIEDSDSYRPRALKELDRIPTPIAAPSPGFPERLVTSGTSEQITVTFYIDEHGAVRLPSINAKDDPQLGAIVIEALRNWKFEPPMCKGRPVLVRASQQFNFRSPAAKAGTASNG